MDNMHRRLILLPVILLYCGLRLMAGGFYATNAGLQELESASIYSIYQDGSGALWLNTNCGLCRFNGNRLRNVRTGLVRATIYGNHEDLFYIGEMDRILRFNIHLPDTPLMIKGPGLDYSHCPMFAEGKQLWVAAEGRLFHTESDSLSLWGRLPESAGAPTAMLKRGDVFVVACESGHILEIGPDRFCRTVFETGDMVSELFLDSRSNLWIGLKDNGIIVLDRSGRRKAAYSRTTDRRPFHDARTFCEDSKGRIFAGTIDGLLLVSPDGSISMDTQYVPEGYAICSLLRDRDNNIWIGTFYRGTFLCESDNSPFRNVDMPGYEGIKLVNQLLEDCRGDVWVITDNKGIFRYGSGPGSFSKISARRDGKYKAASYDRENDCIWIGEYLGALNRYDIRTGRWTVFPFSGPEGETVKKSVYAIKSGRGGELFLGTDTGVYIFNPKTERRVTRRIPGYSGIVHTLDFDGDGTLWAGGIGVWSRRPGDRMTKKEEFGSFTCPGLCCTKGNGVYFALSRHGAGVKDGEKLDFFSFEDTGMAGTFAYLVSPLSDGIVLIGTSTGLSLLDINTGECFNYSAHNGLGINSTREGDVLKRANGEIWVGGTEGLAIITEMSLPRSMMERHLSIEGLEIDGAPAAMDGAIVLGPRQHSLSVRVSDFDYSGIVSPACEYMLEGVDDGWKPFSLQQPLPLMNVPRGKRLLRVRTAGNVMHPSWTETSVMVLARQAWYLSPPAKLLYILFAVGFFFWLLTAVYSRMLLRQQLAAQKKENEDRIRFFINLSHELRTPLTMIIGQLGLFFRSHKEGLKGISNLESSYKNARKMQQIVSDLLDFEKQEQGYSRIEVSKTDLCAFLSESRDYYVQYANYRNIRFPLKLPSVPVSAYIDRTQMQRVLSNIIGNAFKFTPDCGEISIALSTRTMDARHRFAAITISDTGKGIPEDNLDKIFNPFFQAQDKGDESLRHQGTGIGLALSKGIVDLHHGSITASNSSEGGAVFTVLLPLGAEWWKGDSAVSLSEAPVKKQAISDPLVESRAAAQEKDGGTGMTEGRAWSMLIVEDDPDVRSLLVSIFSGSYAVCEASDGAEGFSLAKSRQPDIIISDVMMPVMDGMSLVAKLRQDFETCHIPVILLTALTSSGNEIAGINQGADDYIGKPFDIDVLEARCRSLLEKRAILRSKFSKTIIGFEGLTKTERDADFLSRATGVIEDNLLSSELGVALLCEKLNISRTILDQKIKGITGMTPRVFIETIRMKQACRLLEAGSGNISEIAYMLGFSTPKYFSIRFKKQFGQTPSEWLDAKQMGMPQ